MSIVCDRQGSLPQIQCLPDEAPVTASYTLTEVACKFIFDARLTPGSRGTLQQALIDFGKCSFEEELADVAAKSRHFYTVLTALLAEEKIEILGIATRDNDQLPSGDDRAEHETLSERFLSDSSRIIHALVENKLEHKDCPSEASANEALQKTLGQR